MNRRFNLPAAVALALGVTGPALAHVSYGDLNAVPTQGNTFTRNGWFRGTDTPTNGGSIDSTPEYLGDSHQLQFYKFTLAQASNVNISFTSNQNGLDPAFSLYSGLLPDEAHDDTVTDPQNAVDGNFDPIPHPTDSAYWNSSNIREGQFNALGTWSMANDSAEWGEIQYLTHKNDNSSSTVGASESLLNYFLPAGTYTIAAAGASTSSVNALLSGTVSFSATAVPVPAAVWLLGSGLAGLGLSGRRRRVNA